MCLKSRKKRMKRTIIEKGSNIQILFFILPPNVLSDRSRLHLRQMHDLIRFLHIFNIFHQQRFVKKNLSIKTRCAQNIGRYRRALPAIDNLLTLFESYNLMFAIPERQSILKNEKVMIRREKLIWK